MRAEHRHEDSGVRIHKETSFGIIRRRKKSKPENDDIYEKTIEEKKKQTNKQRVSIFIMYIVKKRQDMKFFCFVLCYRTKFAITV